MMKVVLIGYGHLGKWHAQKLAQTTEIDFYAICELNLESQLLAKNDHPQIKVVSSWQEILNEFDIAFVVTPSEHHFFIVKDLLNHKKHVFCEKPLCLNYKDALELKMLAESQKLVLQVGHSERCHAIWDQVRPRFQNLKNVVIKINRFAPFKGRATDVNVLWDLGIHDLDLILFLFKFKPKKVWGKGFKIRTKHWDAVELFVELENESVAMIALGRNHTEEQRNLKIINSDGVVTIDLLKNIFLVADNSAEGTVMTSSYEKRDHLKFEQEKFFESIIRNKPVFVDASEGSKAIYFVEKAMEAVEKNDWVIIDHDHV